MEVKKGYSWTTYFFGFFPSFIRGDIASGFKLLLIGIITLGIYPLVKTLSINKDYKKFLHARGYVEQGEIAGGFSNKVLEKVIFILTLIVKIIRAFVIIGAIIFMIAATIQSDRAGQEATNLVNQAFSQKSSTQATNTKVSTNTKTSTLKTYKQPTTQTKNTNSISSKPAQNQANQPVQQSNGIYKPGVTSADIAALNNQYEQALVGAQTPFGQQCIETGSPGMTEQASQDRPVALEFYNNVNTVLNQEWAGIKNILTESAYKSLQQNEIQWIHQKEAAGQTAAAENPNEPETSNYLTQGIQTEKRIRYLSNNYLGGN